MCKCSIINQQTQPQMKTYYFYRGGPQRPGFCIGGDLKVPASKGYGHSFLQDTSRCMEAQLSQPYMVL